MRTNHERELKYLFPSGVPNSFGLAQIINLLREHGGYELRKEGERNKNEIYYDTKKLEVLERGDVLRKSKVAHLAKPCFMYKKQVGTDELPWVEKMEISSRNFDNIRKFVKNHYDVKLGRFIKPVLGANVLRECALIEKDEQKFYVTFDNTTYSNQFTDTMVEIEDFSNQGNEFMYEVNDILLSSAVGLVLTKQSKYERGMESLR
jgi:hypothetical protein